MTQNGFLALQQRAKTGKLTSATGVSRAQEKRGNEGRRGTTRGVRVFWSALCGMDSLACDWLICSPMAVDSVVCYGSYECAVSVL